MKHKERVVLLALLIIVLILGGLYLLGSKKDSSPREGALHQSTQEEVTEKTVPQSAELGYSLNAQGLVNFADPENARILGTQALEWEVLPWEGISPANLELFEYAIPTTSQGFEWPSAPINEDQSYNFWGYKLLSTGPNGEYQAYTKVSATQTGIGSSEGFSPEMVDRARSMPGINFYTLKGVSIIAFGLLEVPAENFEGDVVVTPFDVLAPPNRVKEAEESWGE